jgi:hypothetical protein
MILAAWRLTACEPTRSWARLDSRISMCRAISRLWTATSPPVQPMATALAASVSGLPLVYIVRRALGQWRGAALYADNKIASAAGNVDWPWGNPQVRTT